MDFMTTKSLPSTIYYQKKSNRYIFSPTGRIVSSVTLTAYGVPSKNRIEFEISSDFKEGIPERKLESLEFGSMYPLATAILVST